VDAKKLMEKKWSGRNFSGCRKMQKRKGATRPNTSNIPKVYLLVNEFLRNSAKIYN
jgi:hypothetical protein